MLPEKAIPPMVSFPVQSSDPTGGEWSGTDEADSEFRKRISDPVRFRKMAEGRPLIEALEPVQHAADDVNVLEHTRRVLYRLTTDGFHSIKIKGVEIPLPTLLRAVTLYHDVDKGLPSETTPAKGIKEYVSQAVLEELRKKNPSLLRTEGDAALLSVLLQTCDYFGYDLALLGRRGADLEGAIEDLVAQKVQKYADTLKERAGVDIDPAVLLRLQFAIGRADAMAIGMFRKNEGKLDALFMAMKDYTG